MCETGVCTHLERDCDNGNPCTNDSCNAGVCEHPPKCPAFKAAGGKLVQPVCCEGECCAAGYLCCEGMCCSEERCCTADLCCDQACEGCEDPGALSGGEITVSPEVVCPDDTITFTVSGVVDSGGVKRVDCSSSEPIAPVTPDFTWVVTKPDSTTLSGVGPSAIVVAGQSGIYSCTFTATAARECPPPPRPIGPATGIGLGVEVKSVLFTSDHGVLTDYNTDYAGWGGTVYDPRGWVKGGANNPITHTQGQAITANVKLRVEPSGIGFDLEGEGASGALTFHKSGLTSTGADQTVSATSDGSLPGAIDVLEGTVAWSVTVTDGPTCSIADSSGPHKVYVTWGGPGPGPTLKRVNKVCITADGRISLEGIADSLHDMVAAETTFDGQGTVAGWDLLDGGAGDCGNQALCMAFAFEMVGAGYAEVRSVRASIDAGPGNCLDLEVRVQNNQIHFLILDFDPGAGENWNADEGCCDAASHYYAITPKLKAANDYEMLTALGAGGCRQYWVRTRDDIEPGDEGWKVIEVLEEVPIP